MQGNGTMEVWSGLFPWEMSLSVLAVCGVLDSTVAIVTFYSRCRTRRVVIDALETQTLVALTLISVFDMLYCITLLPAICVFCVTPPDNIYQGETFCLYRLYYPYLSNVFLKSTTWVIVVCGISRATAVCRANLLKSKLGLICGVGL